MVLAPLGVEIAVYDVKLLFHIFGSSTLSDIVGPSSA
jgi:hypothetical protein